MIDSLMDKDTISRTKLQALKKHTSAIHCSNALTLLQRKLSNILLFHAYPNLQELEEYKISIKELCNYLGKKGHNYDTVKQALKELISTVVEWNVIDDKNQEDWTASSILASVNIKGSICSYAYSPRMRKLLHNPVTYGCINLLIQSSFTSSYGLALYENCVRYRGLAQTKTFAIDVFRKMMGVSDNKYTIFRDFKRRVLDKAVDEINSLSDLLIEPIIKREGRKVVTVAFKLQARYRKKPLGMHLDNRLSVENHHISNANEKNIIERLQKIYGMSCDKGASLMRSYGADKVEEKMTQIESTSNFLAGNIRNLAGYLTDALRNDYLPCKSSAMLKEEADLKDISAREHKDSLLRAYADYIRSEMINLLAHLNEQQKKIILKEFSDLLKADNQSDPLISELVQNGYLSDSLVLDALRNFLQAHHKELLIHLQSFKMFCESRASK